MAATEALETDQETTEYQVISQHLITINVPTVLYSEKKSYERMNKNI